ncbi:transposase, partial [Acrocarpospora catenulata]|uniref:transposase n=1 Tax=Acrocarpospora catenulata TaxID=2836182 RepID=UPI001BDB2CA2
MNTIASSHKIVVSSDGRGILSQAGGLLLIETLRVSGLGQGLSQALSRWRKPRSVHDPGKIITDLAVALA